MNPSRETEMNEHKMYAALIPVYAFECNDDASMDSITFYDMAANIWVEEDASSSKHNSRLRATDYLILQFSVHGIIVSDMSD